MRELHVEPAGPSFSAEPFIIPQTKDQYFDKE